MQCLAQFYSRQGTEYVSKAIVPHLLTLKELILCKMHLKEATNYITSKTTKMLYVHTYLPNCSMALCLTHKTHETGRVAY